MSPHLCEPFLIHYFKKRNADERLLTDLKKFLKKGLCSTTRFYIVSILKKYGKLTEFEKECLKYDANYKTRKLFEANENSH